MDEMEFTEAQSIMTDLIAEYQEAASQGQQPAAFGEEDRVRTV
jgi:hypothetical protein